MKRFVFVASCHRSGSTIFGLVLGSHSQSLDVGEFSRFPALASGESDNPCNCGAEFRDCALWSEVARCVSDREGWDPMARPYDHRLALLGRSKPQRAWFRLIRHLYTEMGMLGSVGLTLMGARRQIDDMVQSTFTMYEALLAVSNMSVVVDYDKEPARIRALVRARPEDCGVIHLVRDGRGVVASFLASDGKRAWASKPEDAARAWLRENQKIQALLDGLPRDMWMRQRYEDFCREPQSALASLCEFIGIPLEPSMVRFWEPTHHTVGGNRMRFRGDRAIQLDEKWRQKLSAQDLEAFERVAGSANRDLGYGE